MGQTYKNVDKFLTNGIEPDSVFVEIGSERGEGSTIYLSTLAQQHGTVLHSVDIGDWASKELKHPALICHVQSGADWAKKTYPSINKYISVLYLDNFDWIWDVNNIPEWILNQINDYKERFNIDMNNDNCQQEHFNQMLALLPYMAPKSIVLLDDTNISANHTWSGKNGPVVYLLRNYGFNILDFKNGTELVMGRGY